MQKWNSCMCFWVIDSEKLNIIIFCFQRRYKMWKRHDPPNVSLEVISCKLFIALILHAWSIVLTNNFLGLWFVLVVNNIMEMIWQIQRKTTCRITKFESWGSRKCDPKKIENIKLVSFSQFWQFRASQENTLSNFQPAATSGSVHLRKNECYLTFSSPR